MGTSELRDLMFAGAGVMWGAVTVYRGLELWHHERARAQFPRVVLAAGALAIGCAAYLLSALLPL